MLHSVLLHLEPNERDDAVIRLGVFMAKRGDARIRGFTLLDTRGVELAGTTEAAAYILAEQNRETFTLHRHRQVRGDLSKACLEAGVDFDVRRLSGNPLESLPREARFHDLVITSLPGTARGGEPRSRDFSAHDLVALVERGVDPLLVLPAAQGKIRRVLVPFDGSPAAGRAMRAYLGLGILADAEHRLLAVGPNVRAATSSLAEMVDYFRWRRDHCEAGYACGKLRRVLVPYAEKWQADLIVLGLDRGHRLLRPVVRDLAAVLLRQLPCGLFIKS